MKGLAQIEIYKVQPKDPQAYESALVNEIEATRELVRAEQTVTDLEGELVIQKYQNCLELARRLGVGQGIYEWKLWVESHSKLKSNAAYPQNARRLARQSLLPDELLFEDSEVADIRTYLRAKQDIVMAKQHLQDAAYQRSVLLRQSVSNE